MEEYAPVGSYWMHLKTRKRYCVVGYCFLEADGSPAILYQKPTDRFPWARDAREFLDGRFERLDDPVSPNMYRVNAAQEKADE